MQQIHLPKAVCRGVRVDVHTLYGITTFRTF